MGEDKEKTLVDEYEYMKKYLAQNVPDVEFTEAKELKINEKIKDEKIIENIKSFLSHFKQAKKLIQEIEQYPEEEEKKREARKKLDQVMEMIYMQTTLERDMYVYNKHRDYEPLEHDDNMKKLMRLIEGASLVQLIHMATVNRKEAEELNKKYDSIEKNVRNLRAA